MIYNEYGLIFVSICLAYVSLDSSTLFALYIVEFSLIFTHPGGMVTWLNQLNF